MLVDRAMIRKVRILPRALDLAPLASTLWRQRRRFAWFDSALQRPGQGDFSVLCMADRTAFALGRSCRRRDASPDCVSLLRTRFAEEATFFPPQDDSEPLGFTGGWVGYLAYEAQIDFDPAFPDRDEVLPYPRLWFLRADRGITVDHRANRAIVWQWAPAGEAAGWLDFACEALENPVAPAPSRGELSLPQPALDRQWHSERVHEILERIGCGDIYQANLTAPVRTGGSTDSLHLYGNLREVSAGDYSVFASLPGVTVCSTSPELFFQLDGDTASARPMKGTLPRGRDQGEDKENKARLGSSSKDRAENLMIVDLLRNDLGRVAETGTVVVPSLFTVEEYATVFQMTSTIEARLAPGNDVFDVLGALFPPGSMTGAPKVQATRVIGELEPVFRGLYSGCMGLVHWNGDACFNVVIRTLVKDQSGTTWAVGGGIVTDSTAESEYAEALAKLKGLSRALSL